MGLKKKLKKKLKKVSSALKGVKKKRNEVIKNAGQHHIVYFNKYGAKAVVVGATVVGGVFLGPVGAAALGGAATAVTTIGVKQTAKREASFTGKYSGDPNQHKKEERYGKKKSKQQMKFGIIVTAAGTAVFTGAALATGTSAVGALGAGGSLAAPAASGAGAGAAAGAAGGAVGASSTGSTVGTLGAVLSTGTTVAQAYTGGQAGGSVKGGSGSTSGWGTDEGSGTITDPAELPGGQAPQGNENGVVGFLGAAGAIAKGVLGGSDADKSKGVGADAGNRSSAGEDLVGGGPAGEEGSGSKWMVPALIVGAVLLLSKRKG